MSKSKCQTVGYAYFLSFVYVFAEHTTSLHEILLDGAAVWGVNGYSSIKITPTVSWLQELHGESGGQVTWVESNNSPITSDSTLSFRTGKMNDTVPSDSPDGIVHYVTGGDYQMPMIRSWTGQNIKYKNLSALVFDDCFIGDGVRTIPQYSVIVANGQYSKVSGNANDKQANPVDIIYDILKRDLQMSDNDIDMAAFTSAAATVASEGIFVGLVMSSEKKTSHWLDEMLKIIDGAMFYDSLTNKLSIKLLRFDYNPDAITVLDDSVISKLTLDVQSWAETYNKFTFKYTEVLRDDVGSVEYTNTASRISLGYDRPKTIQLTTINNRQVLQIVANRMVAKLGTPKTALKLQVDFIDFPAITVGSVFKLNSAQLGVNGKIFRVLKITGDSEDKSYVNVNAVEDFYAKDLNFDIVTDNGDDYVQPNYTITNPVSHFRAIDASREYAEEDAMFWMGGKPAGTDYLTGIKVETVNGGMSIGQPSLIGRLVTDMPVDISNGIEDSPEYSQDYVFVVEDVDGSLFEILGSSTSLQTLKHTMVIDDEIIAFKSLTYLGTTTYQVEGIIRGLGGTPITAHTANTIVHINGVLRRYTPTVGVPNTSPTIQAYAYNHQGTGPKVTITPTYNRTIQKPYKPVPYLKNGDIVWRPRVARKGAVYQNIDNMVGGEDEGSVTGYYVVQQPDGVEVTIVPKNGDILITFSPTQNGLHKIKHVNSTTHLTEGWVDITA